MKVRKGLGHLTQDEHLLMEGTLLLAVTLQVRTKTGLHLLRHEHWQPRFWLEVYAEELDYAGVTQLRPCQALRLKIADQFRYSSGRLVFQRDRVQALRSGRTELPLAMHDLRSAHHRVRSQTKANLNCKLHQKHLLLNQPHPHPPLYSHPQETNHFH